MNDWIKLQDKEFANDEANAKRLIGIMSATRGLSPECVAACVEAVRADAAYRQLPFNPQWQAYEERKHVAMIDAIALLPKDTP